MKRILAMTAVAGISMASTAAPAQNEKTERGMQVFQEQKCTLCHSIAGKGNKKGPLDEVGSKLTASEIREWIIDPVGMAAKTTPAPTRKPPMKKKAIAPDDVDALVALLTDLRKK
jgi:mono/diheme cytochrome c family protein